MFFFVGVMFVILCDGMFVLFGGVCFVWWFVFVFGVFFCLVGCFCLAFFVLCLVGCLFVSCVGRCVVFVVCVFSF